MPAANVDDALERTKIVGLHDGFVNALAHGDHGALKQSGLLGVFRKPVKPSAAECVVKGRPSRGDGMQKLLEGEIRLAVDHAHEVAGTWPVRAKRGSDLRQPE